MKTRSSRNVWINIPLSLLAVAMFHAAVRFSWMVSGQILTARRGSSVRNAFRRDLFGQLERLCGRGSRWLNLQMVVAGQRLSDGLERWQQLAENQMFGGEVVDYVRQPAERLSVG